MKRPGICTWDNAKFLILLSIGSTLPAITLRTYAVSSWLGQLIQAGLLRSRGLHLHTDRPSFLLLMNKLF